MWLTDNAWILWITVILLALIVEIIFTQIYFLMISGGAVGGLLTSFFSVPLAVQVFVFAGISIALLFLARPWVVGKMSGGTGGRLTNVDALAGEKVLVMEQVTLTGGLVKIGGDIWSARTLGARIPAGASAVVEKVDGATAVVRPSNGIGVANVVS